MVVVGTMDFSEGTEDADDDQNRFLLRCFYSLPRCFRLLSRCFLFLPNFCLQPRCTLVLLTVDLPAAMLLVPRQLPYQRAGK
jgi:hypothetical protein